jgi:homogentisate 1,2-dioxygenase
MKRYVSKKGLACENKLRSLKREKGRLGSKQKKFMRYLEEVKECVKDCVGDALTVTRHLKKKIDSYSTRLEVVNEQIRKTLIQVEETLVLL